MSYNIHWYIPNKVIYICEIAPPTKASLRSLVQTTYTLYDQSNEPLVHSIVDVKQSTRYLSVVDIISVLREFEPHPRVGWHITIGVDRHNSVLAFITNITKQIMKIRAKEFQTFQEAIDFLKVVDITIDWTHVNNLILSDWIQATTPKFS